MNNTTKSITVFAALENYIKKVQDHSDNKFQTEYPNTWAAGGAPKYEYTCGKRWYKVVRKDTQTCVFCFIDPDNGDIYKAAGWNAPAKGVRGNIFDENPPITSGAFYK